MEFVDTQVLGTCVARRGGSSPSWPTKLIDRLRLKFLYNVVMNKSWIIPFGILIGIALITFDSSMILYKKGLHCYEAGGVLIGGLCINKDSVIKI